jgi:hypothetical protein
VTSDCTTRRLSENQWLARNKAMLKPVGSLVARSSLELQQAPANTFKGES